MGKRSYSGGTTALVIVLTLVIIIIGVAFFFWMKIIGGGNELQHATDAGNLNVAKQVLKAPSIAFANADEANEFGDLTDPNSVPPNQVDLLTYDRLVGKAVLVALNAATEGTSAAATNAQNELAMVEGQTYTLSDGTTGTGIGARLASQLTSSSNLSTFFTNLSQANNTRMLANDGSVPSNAAEADVSYMARKKATNIYVNQTQIPAGSSFFTNSANIISETDPSNPNATKSYITGYDPLQCGALGNGQTINPYAVPMRPGQQPHLVNIDDFQTNNTSPSSGSSTIIPPNSFKSGGDGVEGNRAGTTLTMRSSAIIGTLSTDFPLSLPRGYMIVDNTGGRTTPLGFQNLPSNGGGDQLDTLLMSPEFIAIAPGSPDVYGKSTPSGADPVAQVIADANNPAVTPAQFNADLAGIDSPANMTQAQAIARFKATPPAAPQGTTQCNSTNTDSGTPTPNSTCQGALSEFQNTYKGNVPTGGNNTQNNIMAVELLKCDILAARATISGEGCGQVDQVNDIISPNSPAGTYLCSGLKDYDVSKTLTGLSSPPCMSPTNGCVFASPGSLIALLGDVPSANSLIAVNSGGTSGTTPALPLGDLIIRMLQIKPSASISEINAVLGQTVAMGQLSYIYLSSGSLTLSTTPPTFPIVANQVPDGSANSPVSPSPAAGSPAGTQPPACPSPMQCFSSGVVDLDGKTVNMTSCEGYPHPWDCPSLPATGINTIQWTPSSGYNNLLGVLKLFDCAANTGTNWCCPC